jgi:hypothetical protein
MTSFKQSVNCLCSKDTEDVSLVLYSREIDSAFTTVQGFGNRTLAPVEKGAEGEGPGAEMLCMNCAIWSPCRYPHSMCFLFRR